MRLQQMVLFALIVPILTGCSGAPTERALQTTATPSTVVPLPVTFVPTATSSDIPTTRPLLPTAAASPSATPKAEEPQAGATRVWEKDGTVIVYVPAGEFQLGSDADEASYARNLCKKYSGDLAIATC